MTINLSAPPEAAEVNVRIAVYAAAVAASFVGSLGTSLSPFVLSAITEQANVDVRTASFVVSGEFTAFLVASLFIAHLAHLRSARVLSFASMLYAIGSLWSAFSHDVAALLPARLLCGIGGGLVMAGAMRLIAQHRHYQRLFAVALSGSALLSVPVLFVFPILLEHSGARSAYLLLGLIGFLAAPVILALEAGDLTMSSEPVPAPQWLTGSTILILGYFLSRLNDSTIWSYSERLASRVGIGTDALGVLLAVATLIAMTAPFLALRATVIRYFARFLIAMLVLKAIQSLAMYFPSSTLIFIVAQFAAIFSFVFITQMFMTRFADLESSGRLAALGSTVGLTGDAVGPALSGETFARYGLSGVATLSFFIGIIGAVVAMIVLRRRVAGVRL